MTFLLHVGAMVQCAHGVPATIIPASPRVLLGGQPAAVATDQFLVTGCPFTLPPPKPSPCVTIQWIVPAARVRIGGQFAVLQTSTGLCQSPEQLPQGPPIVTTTQIRARGQ